MRDDNSQVSCAAANTCQRLPDPVTMERPGLGTCVSPVDLGIPCDSADGPGCPTNAICVADTPGGTHGVCQPRRNDVCGIQ